MNLAILLVLLSTPLVSPGTALVQAAALVPGEASAPPTVCFQPLGKYSRKLLGKSVTGVKHLYGFPVKVLPAEPLPASAFYKPRKRYRAEKLLLFLEEKIYPDSGCDAIIGFTKVDISTSKGNHKDWGIFGLGSVGGGSCVVSTYRLGRRTKSKRVVQQRTVKVVNHELGHVLGLGHCPKERCLMNDAEGSIKTVDRETGLLCDLCSGETERRFSVVLPALKEIDWDEVLGGK